MRDAIQNVRLSYGRALTDKRLMDRFYDIFLKSHHTIPVYFKHTDLAKQKELLSQSINMAILYPQQNKIAVNAINRIAKSHAKEGLNIKPGLYRFWLNSLLTAIAESDEEFNDVLEQQWRDVLQFTIDAISAEYE
ncbi:MAG: hypothetical protein ACE5EH_06090 [Gammaproteobacteria bacterium]